MVVQDRQFSPGLGAHITDLALERGWQLLHTVLSRQQQASSQPPTKAEPTGISEHILHQPEQVFARLLEQQAVPEEQRPALSQSFLHLQQEADNILAEGEAS